MDRPGYNLIIEEYALRKKKKMEVYHIPPLHPVPTAQVHFVCDA